MRSSKGFRNDGQYSIEIARDSVHEVNQALSWAFTANYSIWPFHKYGDLSLTVLRVQNETKSLAMCGQILYNFGQHGGIDFEFARK